MRQRIVRITSTICHASALTLLLVLSATSAANAGSMAASAAILSVGTHYGLSADLTADSTLSLCVTAGLNPMFLGNNGPGVACNTNITKGDFIGMYAGQGYMDKKKFPDIVEGTMSGGGGGTAPDNMDSTAVTQWKPGEVIKSGQFNSIAKVNRFSAKSPFDVATAEGKDPWFFTTGGTAVTFTLIVTLSW